MEKERLLILIGKRYGVYKDDNGDFYIVDTTCTHLGCELNFNSEEKHGTVHVMVLDLTIREIYLKDQLLSH